MKFRTTLTQAAVAVATVSLLAIFSAGTAAAEPVSLIAHDSYSKISGNLLAYEDDIYTIGTAVGILRVKASSVECEGAGCPERKTFATASSLANVSAGTAAAEPVSLIAHDNFSKVSGELLAYEDGIYLIRTALGDLRVKASSVECEGSACPVDQTPPKV